MLEQSILMIEKLLLNIQTICKNKFILVLIFIKTL